MEFIIPKNVIEWQELLNEHFKSSENKSVPYTGITYTDIRKAPQNEKVALFTDLCSKFGETIYLIDNQKSDARFLNRSHSVGIQQGQAHNIQKLKADLMSIHPKKVYGYVFNDMLASISQIKLASYRRDETTYTKPRVGKIIKDDNSLGMGLALLDWDLNDEFLAELRVREDENKRNIKADLLKQLERLKSYIQANMGPIPREDEFVDWFYENTSIGKMGDNLRKIKDIDLINYVISYKEELDKTTQQLIEQKRQLIIQEQKETTMTNEFKETIRELIRKAKTDKALQELLNWAHRNNDAALTDKVSELTARLKKTNNDVMYGYITDNEADVKQRRLVNTILTLLQQLGENKTVSAINPLKSEEKVLPKVEERKTLKIFLASSYELKADRESFELHFGARKRKTFSRDIDVVLWEDFVDAMSSTRLQDEYNKAVKDCDMFVMLFFTKVGKYTAEEFETAFGQFKDNGKPLIYTYFKNADVKMGDINDDILSMLTFKKKLRDLGHFVTEYANPTDLNFQFSNQLDKLLKDNRI